MFDRAALLTVEQVQAGRYGDVLLRLVGDEVNLETVETGRLVITRAGCALVEVSIAGNLQALCSQFDVKARQMSHARQ